MNKARKGFTLIELLVSAGLLSIVSLVSVSIITSLLSSSVKSQMAVDIEQASSFVFLKMESDIKKAYSAEVSGGDTLILLQGSPTDPVTVTYRLGTGNAGLGCVYTRRGLTGPEVKLTDDSVVNGKPTISAVSVEPTSSSLSTLEDTEGRTVAVSIQLTFIKPDVANASLFKAETTLDSTVVLRGSY